MKARISDQQIRQAAAAVRQSMLKEIGQEEIPEHSFSASFQENIQNLKMKTQRHHNRNSILRRCAAAVILIVLSFSSILMTSTDARAAVLSWFKESLVGKNLFHFQGSVPQDNFPDITLGWIPDGLICTMKESGKKVFILNYDDPDNPAAGFTLSGGYISDGATSIMGYDDAPHEITAVDINGLPGELYLSQDPSAPNGLIWFDDENGVFFVMTSYYSPEIMERIAEGVILVK